MHQKRISTKLPKPEQLPSGSWRCRVVVEIDGNRVRKTFVAATAQEAQQAAIRAKAGIIDEEPTSAKGKTLGKAIDSYIASLSNTLSPATLRGYGSIRRTRVQSLMDLPIDSITQAQFQYAMDLEKKTHSAKTCRNIWALLHAVLKAEGIAPPEIKRPQKIVNTRPFLDDQEVKVFLRAIEGDSVEVALLLALHSLRRSELLGLRWQDIDLEKELIHINGSRVYDEVGSLVWKPETKNSSSRRTVQIIIPRLTELLKELPHDSEYIVNNSPVTIYKHANAICKQEGLPEVGIHGLRHTFASLCFFLGIPEKAIMVMGGWSDTTILRNIYTHYSDRQKNIHTEQLRSFYSG